jgi:hypothetical protein
MRIARITLTLCNIDDLLEMLTASASIQEPLSIDYPHGSFPSALRIYQRALAIACPLLLFFKPIKAASGPHDVPAICRNARLNYYLIANLNVVTDL